MSGARIGVIDYGMGNRRSVEKALVHVGADVLVSSEPARLSGCDGLVLPGVGAFPRGMERLRSSGLDAVVTDAAAAGRPLLGICLGMQLLFDGSTEMGGAGGLGLIPGSVSRIEAGGLRIPHIGWNVVHAERSSPLLDADAAYYHVHSFCARPADAADIVASTEYGERFATVVSRGSVHGVQFHPEKSSRDGLALLARFCALVLAADTGAKVAA
ncbi:MAG TPA: imidazole glycerol phosphate synthase subunit HisH [Solirubrobacteraceae bacterium]|nr:imidazole glycerol phosphate synthase subunit HisH [Solirubrobacteraceae bacterium]